MAAHANAEYLRTLANFLEKDVKSKDPVRLQGAIARLRRAKPPFREMPDAEVIERFRSSDALDTLAFEQGFKSWQEMIQGKQLQQGTNQADASSVEFKPRPEVADVNDALAKCYAVIDMLQNHIREPAELQRIMRSGFVGHAHERARAALSPKGDQAATLPDDLMERVESEITHVVRDKHASGRVAEFRVRPREMFGPEMAFVDPDTAEEAVVVHFDWYDESFRLLVWDRNRDQSKDPTLTFEFDDRGNLKRELW